MDNMKADLITRFRNVFADGSMVDLTIWKVPEPVPPSGHSFKYRAVYVVGGVRAVGFDNERGKGDHKHVDDKETQYAFSSVDQLLNDFFAEVEKWKNER